MEGSATATLVGPPKEPTADEKILAVLHNAADPMGEETIYMHKDDIEKLTALTNSTLENRLSRLVKDGQIHRMPGSGQAVRGKYGLGPTPHDATA